MSQIQIQMKFHEKKRKNCEVRVMKNKNDNSFVMKDHGLTISCYFMRIEQIYSVRHSG